MKGHVFGPQTLKIGNWFNQFKNSLPNPYTLQDDEIEIYINYNMKVLKRNDKVQKCLDTFTQMLDLSFNHKMDFAANYEQNQGVI